MILQISESKFAYNKKEMFISKYAFPGANNESRYEEMQRIRWNVCNTLIWLYNPRAQTSLQILCKGPLDWLITKCHKLLGKCSIWFEDETCQITVK